MGPTVNLAARLMAAASKKQSEPIFVDERVSRAARQSQSTRHVFTAMEPIKAKGFAEPVKVFALAESERDRGRVTASAAHEAQVPFTGREKLLASIDGIVEAAAREDESASPQPDSPGSPRSPLSPKRLLETMGQSTRKLVATTSSASAGALFPGRASSPSGSSRSLKGSATPSPRTSPSLRLRSLSGPPKSDDPESVVRLVCVDGESGLGKSRLLREIAEKHGGAWDVVEASADAVTLQRPFAIWINVIRSLVYARHGGRSPRAADVVRALGRADAQSGNAAEDASLRKRHSKDANPKPSLSRALSTKLRKASGALAGAGDDDKHSLSRFIRERMTKSQVAAYGDRLAFLDGDGMDSPEWTALNKSFKLEVLAAAIAALVSVGESSIALLSHALAILGVDHEALGEDGFASLLASNDREEHLSQSEKKLLARALSQLGWCHVRAGTALDHQFALQLTESCFAHSIRLSKVAGDKLAAADALNGFGTFYQLCASQVGELHATLGDTIRPSPAPAGRRLARSASQGEIPPAVVAAAKADEPPSTPGAPASSLFKRLTHSAPRKGADHDDEPPPRGPGDGKKSANRYKRTNTDATPENLKPPTPPGEHRSLLRFSRLLLLSRPDLWSIAEDKLMESYDIRESSCAEGKPSLDVAQVCVTLGSLQMDMSKIDAARPPPRVPSRACFSPPKKTPLLTSFPRAGAYYALALHMYESELGPLHPRTAHALAGLARIARNQGTKLITDPTPTTRRAGALILDEAIDYQARAVKARSALGQRHGTYQASVAELRAMELQRDALHLTEPAPRSADSPYQPGRAQRRKSL